MKTSHLQPSLPAAPQKAQDSAEESFPPGTAGKEPAGIEEEEAAGEYGSIFAEMQPEVSKMAQPRMIEGTGEELVKLLNQQPKERFRLIKLPNNIEFQTFEEAFAKATSRTPEEIAAARTRVLADSPPPRELPEGKTLEDVVLGQWPGEETDEQIEAALEKLS